MCLLSFQLAFDIHEIFLHAFLSELNSQIAKKGVREIKEKVKNHFMAL